MEPIYHDMDDVARITVGTVGEVGQRTFFIQVRADDDLVTLKLEKQQVAALSETLGQMLRELPRPGDLPEDMSLEEPLEPEFTVGTIGLHYDEEADKILFLVEEMTTEEEEEGSAVRAMATREQAAALAIHGAELVSAGRPPCPLCGFPLDPRGHVCPRTNGHQSPVR